MAVTQGHGNPNWTREEVILALDLYHALNGRIPSATNEKVISLSETLKSLPCHKDALKTESFRNPSGVVFKLQNLRQIAIGTGLSHTGKVDREVWRELGSNPQETTNLANSIRSSLKLLQQSDDLDHELEFWEGRAVTEAHRRLERHRGLRHRLLESRRNSKTLHCDICLFSGRLTPDYLQEAVFEAHHLIPIASCGMRKTRIRDLSLLCANCHRLIHALIRSKKRWVGIEEAQSIITEGGA